jgi:hypothetical protein
VVHVVKHIAADLTSNFHSSAIRTYINTRTELVTVLVQFGDQ